MAPIFDIYFDLRLNTRLSKQWKRGDLIRHRAHCDVAVMGIWEKKAMNVKRNPRGLYLHDKLHRPYTQTTCRCGASNAHVNNFSLSMHADVNTAMKEPRKLGYGICHARGTHDSTENNTAFDSLCQESETQPHMGNHYKILVKRISSPNQSWE